MKTYFLIALLFPFLCYAQKERSTSQERPSIDDCPTWTNKPKNSKAAFFEQARLGRKSTASVQKVNPEIVQESEQDKLIRLNRDRKVIPSAPVPPQEKISVAKKEKPIETSPLPLEKEEVAVVTDKGESKQIEETNLEEDETTSIEKPKKSRKDKIKKERKKIRKRATLSTKKTKAPRSKKQKCPEF